MNSNKRAVDLLNGSIIKGLISFCLPLFAGNLLQQLYNLADAWVVGNFADNNAFAAVSSGGSLTFLIVGFFAGMGSGGGIVISRYFGQRDKKLIKDSIHALVLFAIICSALATVIGLIAAPKLLILMKTPKEVLPYSLIYFRIFFAGITTLIMYNTFQGIMRAVGDSFHPLMYLVASSILNIVLDVLFVAGFKWDVMGAALATVLAQGVSAVLCFIRLIRIKDGTGITISEIFKWHGDITKEIIMQGLPMGIQNSVISIGNIVVQKNINAFGAYAMSGMGAYARVEGFVFLPITSISMAVPTFISQNLGARQFDRAKKGALFSIIAGVALAEAIGLIFFANASGILRFFTDSQEAISFGCMQVSVTAFFYFALAFSHCAAGVLRGAGKSIVPMATMLIFWCGVRITYLTIAVPIRQQFTTISWCYPITWMCSTVVFVIWLFGKDWVHAYEK